MHNPTDRITHTTAFVTPVMEHWLEREIAQWVHPMKDRSDDPSHHERTLLPRSYIWLQRPEMKPTALTTWATLQLAERVLLYAPSHTQDSTYHSKCYISRGALVEAIAQWVHNEGSIQRPITPRAHALLELHLAPC